MLVFRVDEQNFDGGERDGVRIVTGQGLKVDFSEFSPDADTLGLWHLHHGGCQGEGTGLEDASGGGHTLVNYGAAAAEDGYQFVCSGSTCMLATLGARPQQPRVTLECWVRGWQTPLLADGNIVRYFADDGNLLLVYAYRHSNPVYSYIQAALRVGWVWAPFIKWMGAAADAVLAGAAPWHAAVVVDAPNSLRLFVNGVKRAEATSGVAAMGSGTYSLRLSYPSTSVGVSAVIDESRVSTTARYATTFTPQRLTASGTYTSITFDSARLGADWADLVADQIVPSGTGISWEVRAADQTDAFGNPQALWQAYSGDPSSLPSGRYFQWRASLSTSADRFTSPAITSVEASASEAGYDLYRGSGSGPESIDYAQAFARAGPGVREVQTEPLEAGTVHWFGIRPVDTRGIESPITQSEARIELDASGAPVPDRPAGALAIGAQAMPLGAVRLTWRYRPGITGVVPQVFRIFGDGGGGTIDYGSPLGEVAYEMGRVAYAATIEGLASGVEHQLAVRAVAQGEVWDEQPATAPVTPDADAPGEVTALKAEVVP
jgi:hypothetical protein